MLNKHVTFHPIFLKEPVRPEDSKKIGVADLILENFEIQDHDIVVATSKVVSILEGRCINMSSVVPSRKSRKIADYYGRPPALVELIRREGQVLCVLPAARLMKKKKFQDILRSISMPGLTEENWDKVIKHACNYRWGVMKFGFLEDNAGIDCQNVPEGYAVLLPEDPRKSANTIRTQLKEKSGKEIAVLITDSAAGGLLGSIDVPIGYSGIDPIERNWGRQDVFGRVGTGGFSNYIFPIASMSGTVMGGSDESTPIVVIRGFAYKDERPEDVGKNILSLSKSSILEGLFWTIVETVRYFFVWLKA